MAKPVVSSLNLSGNWEILVVPSPAGPILALPIAAFTGALQSNNGLVTGTFRAFVTSLSSNCPSITTDLPVTGTIDAANNLSLTIPLSGGVATVTATLPPVLSAFNHGSYQIVGGTCSTAATAVDLTQFSPVTGTYTGTLTTPGSTPVSSAVSAILTQSTSPDADGRFPLTGSVTVPGICSGTLSLAHEVVSGNGIFPTAGGFLAAAATLSGPISIPTASSIQANLETFSANCSSVLLQGTLTRQ